MLPLERTPGLPCSLGGTGIEHQCSPKIWIAVGRPTDFDPKPERLDLLVRDGMVVGLHSSRLVLHNAQRYGRIWYWKKTNTNIVLDMTEYFGYTIDKRYLPVLLLLLLRPAKDGVTLTDEGALVATFGLFKVATPRSNITGAHITRNYRWWTAVGVRLSRADDGLTFGTNHDGGVCIHFAHRVPSPLRRSGHSALTVTVADLEGLTMALGGDKDAPAAPSA